MGNKMMAKAVSVDYGVDVGTYNSFQGEVLDGGMDYMNENNASSNSSFMILWITIGVCIVLGITLGIILGRKSAMK